MKKIGVVLAIIAIVALAGCASGGGKAGGAEPYIVDLSKMTMVSVTNNPDRIGAPIGNVLRNPSPITRNWQDIMFLFPTDMADITGYSRVTITLKYFNAAGEELVPRDSMGMLVVIYDVNGDWRGPEMGGGPNTPIKEMNVGGFSGMINTDRGTRVTFKQNPQALLVQKAQDPNVAFIELSGIIFHNGNYKFEGEHVQGEGPEGS